MQDPTNRSDRDAGHVEVKNTTCYMCACRCGIRVTLRDGEVRYIQGNPKHPLNQGVICAKGASGIMKQYSPARLTKPLRRKRGSERGDSKFEAISWEETFRILALPVYLLNSLARLIMQPTVVFVPLIWLPVLFIQWVAPFGNLVVPI